MTNKEFLLEVQKSCHVEMPRCLMLIGCLQKMLGNAAIDQVAVVLPGLGVFTSHKHPEYVQENPQTGAMTLFPPRITYHMQSESSAEGVLCAELLSEYAHVETDEASAFVDALVKTINRFLEEGNEIDVPTLGLFKNVLTHQSDLHHIEFLPCQQIKELVNAPFACFEPIEIVNPPVSEGRTSASMEFEEGEETEQEVPEETAVVDAASVEDSAEESAPEQNPEIKTFTNTDLTSKSETIMKEEKKNIYYNDDKESENSTNWTFYISLTLIMLGCGFVLWLMFSDDIRFWDDPPIEAKVVEVAKTVEDAPIKAEPPVKPESVKAEAPTKIETPVEEKPAKAESPEKPSKAESPEKAAKAESEKPAKIETPAKTETTQDKAEPNPKTEAPSTKEFHRMKDADGTEVKVTLQPGSRLTLIALEHYGDKAFWPYIYDVNTDKLKAPNLVQSGMSLYLPDPAYYGIDANDEASVRKAKNRAAQLMK